MAGNAESINEWYESALTELDGARTQLAEAQKRVREAEERVRLLENLISLEGAEPSGTLLSRPGASHEGEDVLDAVVRILKSKAGPVHIAEIRKHLLAEAVPLPGKGNEANLISKFQRSGGRIVRVGRGLYDIPRSGPQPALVYPDGRRVPLPAVTLLGRGDDCDVVLADPKTSRHHARIRVEDGRAQIADAGSANGTYVNGDKVETAALSEGDRVRVGDTVLTYSAR